MAITSGNRSATRPRLTSKTLKKAVSKARSVNRAELSPDQARRLDDLENHLSQHAGMLARLDARDKQREQQLRQLRRDTSGDIAGLTSQLDRLTDALRRHGIDITAATDLQPQ